MFRCVLLCFLLINGTAPVIWGQSAPPAAVETARIDWLAEVLKGGITSAALIAVAVAAVAFILERFLVVQPRNFVPSLLVKRIRPMWTGGHFDQVIQACKDDKSLLGKVSFYIARHAHVPFDILSIGAADLGSREIRRQLQRTYPLAVIATISPLLGLLGTIIGMIEAFQKVALMGDTGDASVLADSIGKALITTALGLVIAIPALGFYHYFKSRISMLGNTLEEEVDEIFALWLRAPHVPESETNPPEA
jgi:biopolymer transport protein ExbB